MKIKAILFDVDGVILSGRSFYNKLDNLDSFQTQPIKDFFDSKEFNIDCILGKDTKKVLIPYLKKSNWKGSIDDFLQLWFKEDKEVDTKLLTLVGYLRRQKIKCYLATNQEQYRANYIWEDLKLKNEFEGMFESSSMNLRKPQKEFFEKIINELRYFPQEIGYFDDSMKHIVSAKNLGIKAIQYNSIIDLNKLNL